MPKSSLQGMNKRELFHELQQSTASYLLLRNLRRISKTETFTEEDGFISHFLLFRHQFLDHRTMSTVAFAQPGWENKSQDSTRII